ncbi:ATP-dependent nuclease [Acetobacterium carbinolicum]|uniref:ATP-dependent nuclease n=1 Tax=Acetobacterium carbinolicum TaxID=52690 RepID=UPI003BF5BE05
MFISEVKLNGFRNFKCETINFANKTLIIGQNDVGKSNLLYGLRLLLDKTISDAQLELCDADFYVHEEIDTVYIQIKFSDITEDCIIEKFKGYIHDSGDLYLALRAIRDITGTIDTIFLAGKDESSLLEISGRFYIKTLNMEYVGSSRNLNSYIKNERQKLLQNAMKHRTEEEIESDSQKIDQIENDIDKTNTKISSLSYIARSTAEVNAELTKMSSHNEAAGIGFSVINNSQTDIIRNLELVSKVNGKDLVVGGYGRNNQIFISLWTRKNQDIEEIPISVTIFCIEEPEAHLHPHQQRKLANYLVEELHGQVILSSHSPQIAAEFEPKSIIRLYSNNNCTFAANNGCSEVIGSSFDEFSYRLNIVPAEAFFSKAIFLVEGPSEELFYKALAKSLAIDLDRENISILKVDGIGFKVYISVFQSLGIPFVIRTDNDVFKNSNGKKFRCAGVQRCIDIYRTFFDKIPDLELLLKKEEKLTTMGVGHITIKATPLVEKLKREFEKINLYLADKDLEHDMYNSVLKSDLEKFYNTTESEKVISKMQDKKALNMYDFLKKNENVLSNLETHGLALPLKKCMSIVGAGID